MPGSKNGFSVGSYSIRLSFLMKQIIIAIKKGKHFDLPHIFLPTDPNTPFSERRDCVTKNFKTHPWYLQKVALRGFCIYRIKWPILKMKQLIKNPGGTFLQIQTDIHVYTDPLLQIIIKICSMYSSSS